MKNILLTVIFLTLWLNTFSQELIVDDPAKYNLDWDFLPRNSPDGYEFFTDSIYYNVQIHYYSGIIKKLPAKECKTLNKSQTKHIAKYYLCGDFNLYFSDGDYSLKKYKGKRVEVGLRTYSISKGNKLLEGNLPVKIRIIKENELKKVKWKYFPRYSQAEAYYTKLADSTYYNIGVQYYKGTIIYSPIEKDTIPRNSISMYSSPVSGYQLKEGKYYSIDFAKGASILKNYVNKKIEIGIRIFRTRFGNESFIEYYPVKIRIIE